MRFRAALDERRLVTVSGPGGIGKTTVAIATANRYAKTHGGMVAFVDLSRAADGRAAVQLIAEALGIQTKTDVAVLREYLRVRNLLLILDTCEHLVEPIAELAEFLLAHCDELKLLATSREALRAMGENGLIGFPPLPFRQEVPTSAMGTWPHFLRFIFSLNVPERPHTSKCRKSTCLF